MMADDAEIDEEIERQLEADAHDRNYVEQPLLDDKELQVVINDHTFVQHFHVEIDKSCRRKVISFIDI
jgi:hypothetical protein